MKTNSIHTHIHYIDNAHQDFLNRGWLAQNSPFGLCISHSLSLWLDRIATTQNVTMKLNVVADRTIKRTAAGTHSLGRSRGIDIEGREIFEPGPLSKMLYGRSDGEERYGYDMVIYFNPEIIDEQLWIDPNPSTAACVPPDKKDLVTMTTHEIFHCLGVAGYRHVWGEEFGRFSGDKKTVFDSLTVFEDDGDAGKMTFGGSCAKRLLGCELPLFCRGREGFWAPSNFFHIDENTTRSIINPVVPLGERVDIQPVDWAVLNDLGYEIIGV